VKKRGYVAVLRKRPRENCHGTGNDADDGPAAQIPGELPPARRGLVQRLAPHEPYPTAVRATGTGFASAVGRIGSLIGPTVIGLILPTAGQSGVFTLGAGAFVIAALVVLILGEETKGRTHEHISH